MNTSRIPQEIQRTARLLVLMNPTQKEAVKRAAALHRRTMSDWVLGLIERELATLATERMNEMNEVSGVSGVKN